MSSKIEILVQQKYGTVARSASSTDHAGVRAVAEAFGYSPEELQAIPAAANMGLSCGNPTAFANLRAGEVLVDLGCGGGLDVFLAAEKLGPTGKAIGIDMTPERQGLRGEAGVVAPTFLQRAPLNLPRGDHGILSAHRQERGVNFITPRSMGCAQVCVAYRFA